MDNATLQNHLLQLFARHEVDLEPDEDGWLVTDGDFPAIRASWHEGAGDDPGRLDVDVVLDEERRIEESFAGMGDGEAACRDALAVFGESTLHLLLAACWYVTDDRRMRIEAWDIGVRTWDVFIGPFTLRSTHGDPPAVPAEALAALESLLKDQSLTPQLHWLRIFHGHTPGAEARSGVLLDNQPWDAGTRALRAVSWPAGAHGYSARCFVMLDVRDY